MSIKVETYTRISVSKFFIIIACWAALFVTSAYAQKKAKDNVQLLSRFGDGRLSRLV